MDFLLRGYLQSGCRRVRRDITGGFYIQLLPHFFDGVRFRFCRFFQSFRESKSSFNL